MAAVCCPRPPGHFGEAVRPNPSIEGDWSTLPQARRRDVHRQLETPIWSMDFHQARSRISIQRFHGLIQQCQCLAIGASLINV
jgi:hypothetical protein